MDATNYIQEMLNYLQFAQRFPICPNGLSSADAWAYLLKKWRDEGKLVERKHWRYGPAVEGGRNLTRIYDLRRVIRLVVAEHQAGNPRPRIAFLCQNYTKELADILTVPAVSSDTEQAASPELP